VNLENMKSMKPSADIFWHLKFRFKLLILLIILLLLLLLLLFL